MPHETLSAKELKSLLKSSFSLTRDDKNLSILVDIPHSANADSIQWKERRDIALAWFLRVSAVIETSTSCLQMHTSVVAAGGRKESVLVGAT